MSTRDSFGISASVAALLRAVGLVRAAHSQASDEAPAVEGTDGQEMNDQGPTIIVIVSEQDAGEQTRAEGDADVDARDEPHEGQELRSRPFEGMLTSRQIVKRRNGPVAEDVAMITILQATAHGPHQLEFAVPPTDDTTGAFTADLGDNLTVHVYQDGRVAYVHRQAFDIDLGTVGVPAPAMARFKEQLAKERVEGELRVFKHGDRHVSEDFDVVVKGNEVTVRVFDFAYLQAHAYGSYDAGVVNPERELAVIEELKQIDFKLADGYTIKFVAVSEEGWLADQAAQTADATETVAPAE